MEIEKEPAQNVKADIEVVVDKWMKKYGDGMEVSKEVMTKFTDLTLNYIYFLVNESDQIAELKGYSNITGDHVKLAIENTETRINVLTDEDVEQCADIIKNTRSHALNTDESTIISHNQPQDSREYHTQPIEAPARQYALRAGQGVQARSRRVAPRLTQENEGRLI